MAGGSGRAGEVARQARTLFAVGSAVGLSDGELLDRFRRREDAAAAEAAFEAIVARHGAMVLGVCRRALRDPDEAEDAFQATFLVLARRAARMRGGDSIGGWLRGVSLRVSAKARGRSARLRDRERSDGSVDPPEPDSRPSAERDAEREEIRTIVLDELARLPEGFREAVALCDLDGCTEGEAARRLGCPVGTVRSRLARGRARLRSRLTRRGLAPSAVLAIGPAAAEATIVPAALRAATARAALLFATRPVPAGAVPAGAAALADGVLLAMTLSSLKLAAAGSTLAALLLAGGSIAATWTAGPPDPADPPAVLPIDDPLPAEPEAEAEQGPPRVVSEVATVPRAGSPPGARPPFEVLVVDEETGRPIPGATVRAQLGPGLAWLTADTEGVARGLRPSSVSYQVVIDAWADDHQSRRARWSNRPDSDFEPAEGRVSIALKRGEQAVGGRVVDEEGRPIPGVTVELSGMREGQTALAFYGMAARTDADGRWSSRSMPADLSDLGASFYHPDYLKPVIYSDEADEVLDLDALKAGTHVMTLRRGVRVEGRVLGPDGGPVPGAILTLPERRGMPTDPQAEADGDGRFTFPAAFLSPQQDRTVRRGTRQLLVAAQGFAPELRAITPTEGMGPLEIRLGPGRTIRGRAVDPAGAPIRDAWVIADDWRGWARQEILLLTDADGRFSWDSAPADPITLRLAADGHENVSIVCSPGDTESVFTMEPTLSADLRVVDAETGTPIRRFELVRGRVDEAGAVSWPEVHSPRDRVTELFGRGYAALDTSAPGWKLRVTAQGYEPMETRTIAPDEGRVRLDLKLRPLAFGEGGGPHGVVVDAEGNPLAGAEVMMATPAEGATLRGDSWWDSQGALVWSGAGTVMADDQGRFTFSPTDEPFLLGAVHASGYGEASRDELARDGRIVVRPWGRVEGRVIVDGKPSPGTRVSISEDAPPTGPVRITMGDGTTTDADGRFAFARVIPGPLRLRAEVDGLGDVSAFIDLEPGGTAEVPLGGSGRRVVGRLRVPGDIERDRPLSATVALTISNSPDGKVLYQIPYPEGQSPEEQTAWLAEWWRSPEGMQARRGAVSLRGAVGDDGTFFIPEVPPGPYTIRATLSRLEDGRPVEVARVDHRVIIPAAPEGASADPFDVGVAQFAPVTAPDATARVAAGVGDPAPAIEAEAFDGTPVRLADHRGKLVLLDFWASWCGPCIEELPVLEAVAEEFAADGRLVLIGLSLDDDRQAALDFLDRRDDLTGAIQAHAGPWSDSPAAVAFGVTAIPRIVLIGPDGTILADGLRGEAIAATIRGALARRP